MLKKLLMTGCILALSHASIVCAQSLSDTEKAIIQHVDNNQPDMLALLEKLVNINSGTQHIAGVQQVGKIVQAEFEKLGFQATWSHPPASMQRAGTLILTHHGTGKQRLLLIGHLDTVFSTDTDFNHFTKHKITATGPGIIDDKGGVVVILSALKALQDEKLLDQANITIVFTGDEENSGKPTSISRKPLIDAAKNIDIALDFEPALDLNQAAISRRGTTNWTIKAEGKSAHSSLLFQPGVGYGAIFELTRILDGFRTAITQKYATVNPGLIVGGSTASLSTLTGEVAGSGKNNIVAQTAIAQGDIRFLSSAQKESMEESMQKIVAKHLPKTNATITFVDAIPAMPPTPENQQLLKQYSNISVEMGLGAVTAVDPSIRGAADLSHVAPIVPACLGGLGPVGTGMHTKSETLNIESLRVNAQRAAILISRLI